MDQLTFQQGLVAGIGRLHAEFGDRFGMGTLLVFVAIATRPNIAVDELAETLGIPAWRLRCHLRTLLPNYRWWQRRFGLIRVYPDPAAPARQCCGLTMKGALVARGLYLMARLPTLDNTPRDRNG